NYYGAPGLSAKAAYRVGAGLVAVAAPDSVIQAIASGLYEPIWTPVTPTPSPDDINTLLEQVSSAQAVLVGPGWGQAATTADLLTALLAHFQQADRPPLVIDADGLNLLARQDEWWEQLPQNT